MAPVGPVDIITFVNVAVSATSANGALPTITTGRHKVLLVSSTNLYWNSGAASVTATTSDKYLPANTPLLVHLPAAHDNIGAIRSTADGVLTIYVIG